MDKTGSIAIARALRGGRGAILVATGILVLVVSAIAHATFAHLAAALLFGLGMVALHLLARLDEDVLGTPWATVVRLTDVLSLAILGIATFGPLTIVSATGHPGWDVPVLAGILLVWWAVLDLLIADYRRIRVALILTAVAWLPVVVFDPTRPQVARAVAILAAMGLAFSAWSILRAIRRAPKPYRIIELTKPDEEPRA